jgi:hypothetical protein
VRPRTAWRLSVLAGLVAFVCSFAFGKIPGLVACGTFAGSGQLGPILAFELARTPADVAALFGSGACRTTLVDAQIKGLWLDALGFIPSYTAFLVLAAIAASRGRVQRTIVAMLLIAGLSDEIEGLVMWRIMGNLPGTDGQLGALYWAVHVKFALLAIGTALIGLELIRTFRLWPMLFGLIIAVGGGAAIYGFWVLPNAMMMAGFTYAWFAILVTATVASFAAGTFAPRVARISR